MFLLLSMQSKRFFVRSLIPSEQVPLKNKDFVTESSGRKNEYDQDYFTCSIKAQTKNKGIVSFESSEKVFQVNKQKSSSLEAFGVGRVQVGNKVCYLTKANAQLAALAVMVKQCNESYFEEKILANSAVVAVLYPHTRWDQSMCEEPRGNNSSQEDDRNDPIACLYRTSDEVLWLDMPQMRYLDQIKFGNFRKVNGNFVRLENEYIKDGNIAKLPPENISYLKLRKQIGRDGVITRQGRSIATVKTLPKNTVSTKVYLDDSNIPDGTVEIQTCRPSRPNHRDTYFYTPKCRYEIRSQNHLKIYLELLKEFSGESEAWKQFSSYITLLKDCQIDGKKALHLFPTYLSMLRENDSDLKSTAEQWKLLCVDIVTACEGDQSEVCKDIISLYGKKKKRELDGENFDISKEEQPLKKTQKHT